MLFNDISKEDKAQITSLLRQSGSADKEESLVAQQALAAALQEPLRQGVLTGNIISGIFAPEVFDPNSRVEYPIDFYRPDNASEFVAYTIPNQGRIPERHVEGDYVTVPTYDIGAGIDWLLRYAREARWDIMTRAMEVLEAGFVKKMNDDGWHTILTAGFDRNILINDSNATAGQFTKRLVSLMKLTMRRNAGGNSTSLNRGRLTHLFVSPEAMEDIRNWGIDEVDEVTRREIFTADDGGFSKIFGVTLVDLDELGDNQEYQTYYETVPAVNASNNGMASTDVELVVGMDLQRQSSMVMPIREELEIHADETMHRSRRSALYGWQSQGFAVLDNRVLLLGSL